MSKEPSFQKKKKNEPKIPCFWTLLLSNFKFSFYLLTAKLGGMSASDFRKYGKEMVDYIVDYLENIQKKRVVPAIEPGYLRDLLPDTAPHHAESYEAIISDFDKYIMPGVNTYHMPCVRANAKSFLFEGAGLEKSESFQKNSI